MVQHRSNKGVIVEYVNNLPPPRLMYSVNHNKKQSNSQMANRTSTTDYCHVQMSKH